VTKHLQRASTEEWFQAYEAVYRALPARASRPCPNCGHDDLHVAFTGYADERVGWASFWCGHCLFGLHLSRVSIPEGVEILDIDLSPEQHAQKVPNYTIIPPD
jgi:hypothetical protein